MTSFTTTLFLVITLLGLGQSFAEVAGKLNPNKPFICTTDTGEKITISIPNPANQARSLYKNSQTTTFQFCVDTTANDFGFGAGGGELGCFDNKFNAQLKFDIVLETGVTGKTGKFTYVSLSRKFQPITGTCVNGK